MNYITFTQESRTPSLVITQESRKTATIMNGSDFSSREKFDGEILVLDFGLERGA